MPVTLEMLGGTSSDVARPTCQYAYTRRKIRDSKPPRESDTLSWRWNGASAPMEVVRSPINPASWVTTAERDLIVSELLPLGWAFKKRKGLALVPPHKGVRGWLKQNGRGRRRLHEHSGFGWSEVFGLYDDGL